MRLHSLAPKQLYIDLLHALQAWRASKAAAEGRLAGLRLLALEQERQRDVQLETPAHQAVRAVVQSALDELRTQNQAGAVLLRARFLEGQTIQAAAVERHISVDTANRLQRAAIRQLADLIATRERATRRREAEALESALPAASYVELYGLEEDRPKLITQLEKSGAPWIVAVTGLGGIGKTALAHAVVRDLIPGLRFSRILWLRAEFPPLAEESREQPPSMENLLSELADRLGLPPATNLPAGERLLRLREALGRQTTLVVIDNLEADNALALLQPRLNELVNPTKFLLTSRARPAAEATVFTHVLHEMDQTAAGALIRSHARQTGMAELAQALEPDLEVIYAVIGGNPLALKLVVGLAPLQPLSQILDDLRHNQPGEIDTLYRRIYARVWGVLNPPARTLLMMMPLVGASGATADHLLAVTALPASDFWAAVKELVIRSLLEARGGLHDKRYGIHRLTERFVRLDIVDWRD